MTHAPSLDALCQPALWRTPRGSGDAEGRAGPGLRLLFCPPPPRQDVQQLLQLQQLVLVPGHHLQPPAQFLLPQAQQSQPGKALTPDGLPNASTELSLPPSPCAIPLVPPGLLPTPNLFQLPQQTQGALLTSQPRAGLPTQVSGPLRASGCGQMAWSGGQ